MDIVKKNLISIICGVVALLALVAVFVWPLDGYFETLKENASKRADQYKAMNTLLSKQRVAPIYDPNNPNPVKLTKYPSKTIIDKGDLAQKAVGKQSEAMYDFAVQLNQKGHELVVPNTLPSPVNNSDALGFHNKLQDALKRLREDYLAAGVPPTEEERKSREEQLWKSMEKDIIVVDGQPTNLEIVKGRFEAERLKLPDIMKNEMATKNKMYIDPLVVMAMPKNLPEKDYPSREAIWWAQVQYWVYSDVAAAIAEVNSKSNNVLQSPIKNLLALDVPPSFFPGTSGVATPRLDAGDGGGGATSPTGGRPDATIALPEGNAGTPTRRLSNNLYDVLQFKMTVDIEADKIPLFLKTLATNRFMTVTRVEMNPVDSQEKQRAGYVYGPRPVVTLSLDVETLLMREWTIRYMPPEILRSLDIPSPDKATPKLGQAQ